MKKIAFLMATPFSKGGEQRVVTVLSNLLFEKNYDVTILCTDFTPVNRNLYNMNEKVHIKYIEGYDNPKLYKTRVLRDKLNRKNLLTGIFKHSLIIQKYINLDRGTAKLLIKIINDNNYDCVISLSTLFNTMLAIISDKVKAKTIGWQHSYYDAYFEMPGRRHYNQDKFSKYMFKKLDDYVVLTNYDKNKIKEKFGVDVTVIHNVKSLISKKVSKLEQKRFVALGRFVKVKNFEMMIDMFNEFHKKNKEWTLHIYGEGQLEEELKKKIKNYKLKRSIIIHPYENDVSKCYLNASIYLMTSQYEGWPMVITEAMEFGLPIISWDIPCVEEIIEDNKNGFLIKRYNQDEFVSKMLELANNPKKMKNMGKQIKYASELNSNEKILKQWIDLFEKV